MSTSLSHIPGRIDATPRKRWQMRAVAIVIAVAVNVIILIIARIVNGEYPVATVGDDDQTIGFALVIFATLLAGLVAWGLLALLERMTPRGKPVWTTVAVIVFLLSLFGPFGSGVGTASKLELALMHLGAAATIIPLMRRSVTGGR